MKPIKKNGAPGSKRAPDIFSYHDYRVFLAEWFSFLRTGRDPVSMRELAAKVGISNAYLPSVLHNKRKMSAEVLDSLLPHLRLNQSESDYLSLLRTLSDASSPDSRKRAFGQIQKLRKYRHKNPKEVEVFHYLDNWYYVAIRELAQLPDFSPAPQWICEKLSRRITPQQAQQAINFLMENGHLEINHEGKLRPKEKDMTCVGGVYRIAIGSFHQQMLGLSGEVLRDVKSDEQRHVTSYTLAMAPDDFPKLRDIMEKCVDQIEALGSNVKNPESIYHVTLVGIPLSKIEENAHEVKKRR